MAGIFKCSRIATLLVVSIIEKDDGYQIFFSEDVKTNSTVNPTFCQFFTYYTKNNIFTAGEYYQIDIYKYQKIFEFEDSARILNSFINDDFKKVDQKQLAQQEMKSNQIDIEEINDKIEKRKKVFTTIGTFIKLFIGMSLIAYSIFLILVRNSSFGSIPFLVCGILILVYEVLKLLGKSLGKGSTFFRFYFWFGFLCLFDYLAMVEKDTNAILISLLFWGVGIYMMIMEITKHK